MKIEIEIPDELLARAESIAEAQGTSLSALIEAALRQALPASADFSCPFTLQKHAFRGERLHPSLTGANWDQIRALAYEDCGG